MGGVLVMKLVLIYSLVLNSMSIFCCSSMQLNHPRLEGNETDRLALLAIKAQIQHDPNRVTSSWNETLHFCLWHGITCSRRHRQRVTKLELGSLASFDLENNSFTHQIPPQIGHLHRLQVLLLHNNSLTGTIPANISNCFELITLFLRRKSRNNLVGKIPPELSSLSKLQFLIFNRNNLTGEIPPSLGNLSSLENLITTGNNLEGSIPSSLCQLRKLTYFNLARNRLSGIIPSCIYNLSSIVLFDVGANQIQGSLPSNLSNAFPSLQIFSVHGNHFTGAIPSSISKATNLVVFQCPSNKLSGQVPNLQNLHDIWLFSVYDNNLGSSKDGDLSFVSELINVTQLTNLLFDGNNFGGTLPTSISNLSINLQILMIGENHLHGLGNLVSLQLLSLEESSFTGSIPTNIGQLSGLERLFLNNNQLSGSIPSSLGNLTLLTIL
ncbi:putative non-specific serine/threonine protein kinase [Rosa chinensis]|uniref:Putative non-specific serine/threonine protein kinase n=1 Tax=Rosa chinensis TaxID=74649 RepID=A0A2P6SHG6_ROSCH|nr:putative non-specific serine/threonine protein kinase [Rosa chinensis]